MSLHDKIIDSFQLKGKAIPIQGGQNTSFKVDHTVLKPIDDFAHYEWIQTVINAINPTEYRLASSIKSNDGTYVKEGWICSAFEKGEEKQGFVTEKLAVSKLFHQDLRRINVNDFIAPTNAWETAHEVAWQKRELPKNIDVVAKSMLTELLNKVNVQESYQWQIVHGDLSGNILFVEGMEPLIIDFSPTIAPVEYAEAILVCDCIAWQSSDVSALNLLTCDNNKEMIIRAVIFRLTVAAIFAKGNQSKFLSEYNCFKKIINHIVI
jgi:uncharacterized protein (TIGR02569 family)